MEDDESSLLEHSASTVFPGESSSGTYGGVKTGKTCCDALFNLLDFTDEKSDVSEHFGQIFMRVERLFRFREPLPTVVLSANLQSPTTNQSNNVTIGPLSPFPAPLGQMAATRAPIGGSQASKTNYESFN